MIETYSTISKLKGNEKLTKAIIDNDIIAASSFIMSNEDREYVLKHLIITHAKIKSLVHTPYVRIEKARDALSKLGYNYRYVYDIELAKIQDTGVIPNPIDYGHLAVFIKETSEPNELQFTFDIDLCFRHAIVYRDRDILRWIMTHDFVQYGSDEADMIVRYDQVIKELVGPEVLTEFWLRVYMKNRPFYRWMKRRNEHALNIVRQYITVPNLVRSREVVTANLTKYDSYKDYYYADLNFDAVMPYEGIGIRRPVIFFKGTEIVVAYVTKGKKHLDKTLTPPFKALYDQMPLSFKEFDFEEESLIATLEILYYKRQHPVISLFLQHHNIDMKKVDDLVTYMPFTQYFFDTNTMIETDILITEHGCVLCLDLRYDKTTAEIGGLIVSHNSQGIIVINLKDTLYSNGTDIFITLDFDRCICIYPNRKHSIY